MLGSKKKINVQGMIHWI